MNVLDILVDEHESVEIHSQSNVKSIVANVKIQDSRKYDCQSNEYNPTLSNDRLARHKDGILCMNPKLLTATNHDTTLNLLVTKRFEDSITTPSLLSINIPPTKYNSKGY